LIANVVALIANVTLDCQCYLPLIANVVALIANVTLDCQCYLVPLIANVTKLLFQVIKAIIIISCVGKIVMMFDFVRFFKVAERARPSRKETPL